MLQNPNMEDDPQQLMAEIEAEDKAIYQITETLRELEKQGIEGEDLVSPVYMAVASFVSQTHQKHLMCDLIRMLSDDIKFEMMKHPKLR